MRDALEEDMSIEDNGEEEMQEVKVMEQQAEFNRIVVWGHEKVPELGEDEFVRGVEEWIGWAAAVSFEEEEEEEEDLGKREANSGQIHDVGGAEVEEGKK